MRKTFVVKLPSGVAVRGAVSDLTALALASQLLGEQAIDLVKKGAWKDLAEIESYLNEQASKFAKDAKEVVAKGLEANSGRVKDFFLEMMCNELEIKYPKDGDPEFEERSKAAIAKIPSSKSKEYKAAKKAVLPELEAFMSKDLVLQERLTSLVGRAILDPECGRDLIYALRNIYEDLNTDHYSYDLRTGNVRFSADADELRELMIQPISVGLR